MDDQIERKLCVVCAETIPKQALICVSCQSYQDWRRHLSIGNSSLALIVALLAVLGPATSGVISLLTWREDALTKKVEFAIAELSQHMATVLVSNRSDRAFIVSEFQCQLMIPFDRRDIFGVVESADDSGFRWPIKSQTFGVLASFEAVQPQVVWAQSQATVVFISDYISPPLEFGGAPEMQASSLCYMSGKTDSNGEEADGQLLRPRDLLAFDALEVIERMDFGTERAEEKEALVSRVVNEREQ
ncbi:hypothetical protein [Aliiroseovarius sp. PrR006]|uniref:hypothetical protein n=1 Tax=Aliiroseovarius sp. PrR006 TaxID=2706883 RepID=UPI0013D4CF6D|nr:hypothetical protein [Aliiroseovarius sp. PrR006]NDW51836.1 hypothetical protein [Aliiroseovarius sp. PrR006]